MAKKLTGWRYAVFITGFISFIGAALYPIVIDPLIDTEKYRNIQRITRAGIDQEKIQPGNMKVWSDPFDRRKDS